MKAPPSSLTECAEHWRKQAVTPAGDTAAKGQSLKGEGGGQARGWQPERRTDSTTGGHQERSSNRSSRIGRHLLVHTTTSDVMCNAHDSIVRSAITRSRFPSQRPEVRPSPRRPHCHRHRNSGNRSCSLLQLHLQLGHVERLSIPCSTIR